MAFTDISDIAFPWDLLTPFKKEAESHPDGLIDLSVGTPVDPTPEVVRAALRRAADAHGYPLTYGSSALRSAVAQWFADRRNVPNLDPRDVLPTIGSKELVGLLPSLLNLKATDVVVFPRVAYPTYEVGTRLAGATPLASDDVSQWRGNPNVKLVWVNSPGNPHGEVASVEYLREVVRAAREIGALVVSDECYSELPWTEPFVSSGVPSALDPLVVGEKYDNVLVTYSLSKQSNMAGYRAAFVAGDAQIIQRLLAVRKHLGMIVPAPVQNAMIAALSDYDHVSEQYGRYGRRREILLEAITATGMEVSGSDAGLYLWVKNASASEASLSSRVRTLVSDAQEGMPGACWETVGYFAERGILIAPGAFYGRAAADFVRVALTATDAHISLVAKRLA